MGSRRIIWGAPATIAVALLVFTSGCSRRETLKKTAAPLKGDISILAKKTIARKGAVLILEYHKVVPHEARWDRSIDRFCEDLHLLYNLGFRPVTMSEYLNGKLDRYVVTPKSPPWPFNAHRLFESSQIQGLPPGTHPVVITFDDSHPSQLRLKADGSLDPDCALGIWNRFAKTHPDFPVKTTLFVLPWSMWGQKHMLSKKLQMLKAWGCELGSHTMSHRSLRHLTNEQAKKELAFSINHIQKLGFTANTLALPYGVAPKNRGLLTGFMLWGKWYHFEGVLLGGAGPARLPGSKGFDSTRIPRIQGISSRLGINYWLRRVKYHKLRVYRSPK